MKRVRIEVTKDQIDFAIPRDSSHCMIADAVKSAVPLATHVSVDLQTIRFSRPDLRKRFTFLTPRIAQLALVNWDAGNKPDPFHFYLRQPHTTNMSDKPFRAVISEEEKKAKSESMKEHQQQRRKLQATLKPYNITGVEGGQTPPLQPSKDDPKVPHTRRRRFGLRALDM